jgi:hypothetical protein
MTEAMEKKIADLEKELSARDEMLALVLNETGPVTIDRQNRKPLHPNSQIMVDINSEAQTVTISLVAPVEGIENAGN